jgi:hypothetical protein
MSKDDRTPHFRLFFYSTHTYSTYIHCRRESLSLSLPDGAEKISVHLNRHLQEVLSSEAIPHRICMNLTLSFLLAAESDLTNQYWISGEPNLFSSDALFKVT